MIGTVKTSVADIGIIKATGKHSLQAGDSDSPDNNNPITTLGVSQTGKYLLSNYMSFKPTVHKANDKATVGWRQKVYTPHNLP